MNIIDTNNINNKISFEESLFKSIPNINSLWFLKEINKLTLEEINNLKNLSIYDIAFIVLNRLLKFKINKKELKIVIKNTFNFPIKVKKLDNNIYVLETFHGPTNTFKDFGARFLANYLKIYLKKINNKKKFNLLVSTSGDTGSAIASAFYKIKNIKVIILYPSNRISNIQELQISTYGKNIISFKIDNNFDICQDFVKKSFLDNSINHINLLSANSINLGRLIPQTIYYIYSFSRIKTDNQVIFSVPCGNCGNLTAGLICKKMGLPIKFIANQNINSTFINYLTSGDYLKINSKLTYSSAMDVGDPSNFKRIKYMYTDLCKLKTDVLGNICNEQETIKNIEYIWHKYKYVIDPHTSVSFDGVIKYYIDNKDYVVVSTCKPFKFKETVKDAIKLKLELPFKIKNLLNKKRQIFNLNDNLNNYDNFIDILKKINNNKTSITLIGMPGSGKTITSKYIKTKYNINYIELDKLIEKNNKKNLFELIKEYGDQGLKNIEEKEILSINLDKKNIISTGGSVIYSCKGMKYLKNTLIIYLNCDFEILKKRTKNFTNRGIVFNGLTPKQLYLNRHKLYMKYANLCINTKNLSVNNIGNLIINLIK